MAETHRPGKRYPPEYRVETADYVLSSGKSIRRCAEELGINDKTLSGWVADRKRETGAAGTARLKPAGPPRDPELDAARKRIRELELENDFLRKAAAYFARGQQ
jgi:transposase